jgi:hypothetical protein
MFRSLRLRARIVAEDILSYPRFRPYLGGAVVAWPLAARAAAGADAADHLTPHLHPQQTAAIKAN